MYGSGEAFQRRTGQADRRLQPRRVVLLPAVADAQHGVALEHVERRADRQRAPERFVADALDLAHARLLAILPLAVLPAHARPELAGVRNGAQADRARERLEAVEAI